MFAMAEGQLIRWQLIIYRLSTEDPLILLKEFKNSAGNVQSFFCQPLAIVQSKPELPGLCNFGKITAFKKCTLYYSVTHLTEALSQ